MTTSRDVARLAGVSQSTVSYVLTGKRPISEETRQRVEAAMEQLMFQPNAGARALASQRTGVIGLVVPFGSGTDTTGLLPFIETITIGARERDMDVLLVASDEGPSALTRLEGRKLCDAIVLMEIEAGDARIPVATALRVPVVLIGVPDDPRGLPCVDVDFESAARAAVADLAGTGHDRVALIGHAVEVIEKQINFVRRFEQSAVEAAESFGVRLDVVAPVESSLDGARRAVAAALAGGSQELGSQGLGFVVAQSAVIQSVLRALAERGVQPGRDVSVIGVSTDAAAEAMQPAVTNVSLEPRDVSRRALQTLFRMLDDPSAEPMAVELLPSRLTRRETSTSFPSASGPSNPPDLQPT